MARPLQRPDLALAASLALFVAAVIWLLLTILGSSGAHVPQLAAEASAAETPTVAETQALPDVPGGRENPLVALPESGTPILKVQPGSEIALSAKPGGDPVVTLGDTTEFGSPTVLTVLEREGNWVGVPTEKLPNGELGWLKVSADASAYKVDSAGQEIIVDLSSLTAELKRGDEVERRWSIGIGAADTPTPTGRFSITDSLDNTFNPTYGCCILPISATQPKLPAGWTGGNRMALHGTTSTLGQANSTGCIRNSEEDLRYLMSEIPLGTPVTIKN